MAPSTRYASNLGQIIEYIPGTFVACAVTSLLLLLFPPIISEAQSHHSKTPSLLEFLAFRR
jgi:hypothetical protein